MASQVFNNVEILIFSGGGGAGRSYPAAIITAVKKGSLNLGKIRQVWGTSVGAIVALGVALDMTPEELKQTTDLMPSERFKDNWSNWLIISYLISFWKFITTWGWFRGKGLAEVLNETIADAHKKKGLQLPKKPLTFRQFSTIFKKDLRVVTTDITTRKPHVFCAAETPDESVADAIARSAGIPLAYSPFEDQHRHLHVDGGLMANYAVDLACTANPRTPASKILGLVLLDTESTHAVLYHLRTPITSIMEYFQRVWALIYLQLNTVYTYSEKAMTIVINRGDYNVFNFEPTKDEQRKLNIAAEKAVERKIAEEELKQTKKSFLQPMIRFSDVAPQHSRHRRTNSDPGLNNFSPTLQRYS